ncbi:MAG: transcriptional regulator GcvA [Minwuia sp.]|uniref:transcriptional regulator GcvA n=1 Tax=Minwuia sp. TaxID=2493630 RepID=UPI003A880948
MNALRAFEAAARHESFKAAAEELSVTPAAVGHQIRTLEDYLGVELFTRLNRSVELTDRARRVLPGLTAAFDSMVDTLAILDDPDESHVINVSTVPSFAVKWLIPRLERFNRSYPDYDVRISASVDLADFRRDHIDCSIRFGRGIYPGLKVWKILDDTILPAASPSLLEQQGPAESPADLARFALVHDDSLRFDPMTPDWRAWLTAAGVDDIVDWRRGAHFSFADHALQAAIDGVGIVLARRSIAEQDIADGRLVPLFATEQPLTMSYWFATVPEKAEQPRIVAFRDWMLAEAAEERGVTHGG